MPAVGRNSSVDTATSFGLDGPRIETRRVQGFPHPSIPVLGPIQPRIPWVPGLFPGTKAAGGWYQTHTPIKRRG